MFELDQVLGKNVNRRWREGAEERLLGPEKNYKDSSGLCDAEPGQGFQVCCGSMEPEARLTGTLNRFGTRQEGMRDTQVKPQGWGLRASTTPILKEGLYLQSSPISFFSTLCSPPYLPHIPTSPSPPLPSPSFSLPSPFLFLPLSPILSSPFSHPLLPSFSFSSLPPLSGWECSKG